MLRLIHVLLFSSYVAPHVCFAESSDKQPDWNFWKYLVGPDGKVVNAWGPTVSVEEIRPHVTELVRKRILKKKDEL